ncbi:hypothetical protein GCM10009530_53900 [Microbispora corallina]|uniref:Gram-positive cocci surface proteins LPxTG domain-containing protein n=1 Tax=Microbispora corallina TaxID=83302 RepID=A0ABQ4G4M5_9ACTN|nr:hypothetical protein [Microbispora corallina]GIH42032.1 hypothetical protein Mco01_50320 [Microbispora corallina]
MSRVTQVAVAGLMLLGAVGCSARADSSVAASPTITLTPALPSPAVTISRQDIRVTVDPARITGGSTKSIHITAGCPLPQGGPEYRATARSDAFTGLVTLVPPQTSSTTTPTPAATVPEVRGSATIKADAKPGGYRVQVRCEATNDIGGASFRIVAPSATHTRIPTRAPHAGGGGTAAGGPADDSSLPTGATFLVILAALAVGVGVVRRRSGA